MTDAIYGCDGCRTTIGRSGCPTHRDSVQYVDPSHSWSASTPVLTHCQHGLDLRLHPRCYLCNPEAAQTAPLDERYRALVEAARAVVEWGSDSDEGVVRMAALRAALAALGDEPKGSVARARALPGLGGERD